MRMEAKTFRFLTPLTGVLPLVVFLLVSRRTRRMSQENRLLEGVTVALQRVLACKVVTILLSAITVTQTIYVVIAAPLRLGKAL